jgi:hypothetical protein
MKASSPVKTAFRVALACLASLVVPARAAEPVWTSLSNGKDLGGWVQRGGQARYRVDGAEIVGSSVPRTANSFLCTARSYTNFVLELEFLGHPGLNSGIQIRSQCFEAVTEVQTPAKTFKIPAGRVHGYQVEIDPSSRAWTGGIYDEGRRGWLNDLSKNEPARKAYKAGEWNRIRIEARGPSIRTWLNGVPAADLKDDLTPSGFIALQVHGVGDKQEPMEIRWRNVRIEELP